MSAKYLCNSRLIVTGISIEASSSNQATKTIAINHQPVVRLNLTTSEYKNTPLASNVIKQSKVNGINRFGALTMAENALSFIEKLGVATTKTSAPIIIKIELPIPQKSIVNYNKFKKESEFLKIRHHKKGIEQPASFPYTESNNI